MASRSENAEIAVLQDQMTSVKESLVDIKGDTKSIKSSLDNIPIHYLTKVEFEEFKKELKDRNLVKVITTVLVTAVITAMALALIQGRMK